eukprot:scaffold137935_cov39-Prasinocladus_malaysianus.AAC.1
MDADAGFPPGMPPGMMPPGMPPGRAADDFLKWHAYHSRHHPKGCAPPGSAPGPHGPPHPAFMPPPFPPGHPYWQTVSLFSIFRSLLDWCPLDSGRLPLGSPIPTAPALPQA